MACVRSTRRPRGAGALLARPTHCRRRMDLVYIGLIVAFFALSWGLVVLGERLAPGGPETTEEHSR
jgi:hypothetical protein